MYKEGYFGCRIMWLLIVDGGLPHIETVGDTGILH